jgi:hypothetical protein
VRLRRSGAPGRAAEVAALRGKTIHLVARSGCCEYFSPYIAEKAGADTFSRTAALLIDLLAE